MKREEGEAIFLLRGEGESEREIYFVAYDIQLTVQQKTR